MRPLLLAVLAAMVCPGAFAADLQVPLKPGAGDDLTGAYCNACHTSNYIVMNSPFLTASEWKAEVTKMRGAYGAPIDDDTATKIEAYLGSQYGVAGKP
jgi:mono/diheme cytochrome c family protein